MRRSPFAIVLSLSLAASASTRLAHGDDWELRPLSGSLSARGNFYAQPIDGFVNQEGRVDAELQESVTNGTWGARVTPWGWLRIPDAEGGLSRQVRPYGELKDAWVEYTSTFADVRVGNQVLSWGAADQLNPTDVWNPRDFYDPFNAPKLPILAADVKLHPSGIDWASLELVFTPFFRPSQLPISIPDSGVLPVSLTDSRWLLPAPSGIIAPGGLSAPLQYQVAAATYPETWQAGARLSFLRLGGWDFSVSGYDGVETTPRIAITQQGNPELASAPVVVTLNPSYHRTLMAGVDGSGSVTFGDVEIGTRFEVAYFFRDNSLAETAPASLQSYLLKDDYVFGVAGIDYTFQHKIFGSVLYVNLQYAHYQRIGTLEQDTPGPFVVDGLPNIQVFDDDLLLYWENRFGSKLKFSASVIASLEYGDGLLIPMLTYQWTGSLKTSVSAEIFGGDPIGGFFGQLRDDSRGVVAATYAF
jgi:hypothetical protein